MGDALQIATLVALTQERNRLQKGLRHMLELWDRRDDSGWTAADVLEIEEIRMLVGGIEQAENQEGDQKSGEHGAPP